ncbi:hypothetical protein KGQ20_04520 [Catenulispora sp. NF23]|uniref:Uncharacterized protein n=1 Tax=Catenulispora pinistramenti TaxID=2705254 RepID=A0ABS5KL37_9ACTN|nr:hypothetical protein [Catenulispora pinistramenti]MBS2532027.1 hypothetical protein [Catenulispora pinistramenti]MBS2546745.1 hypothetical protein [Catenulispora pinistramenti]
MSTNEPTAHRKHAKDSTKRLRRIVPLVTAATISASLVAAAAGPASAAARPGEGSVSSAAMMDAATYVHVSEGHVTIDTLAAQKAGVSSQALSAEGAIVADLNRFLDTGTAAVAAASAAHQGAAVSVAMAIPAAAQDKVIQIAPGVTLTIGSTSVELSLSKDAVTEIESVVGFGAAVAALVTPVLVAAGVPNAALVSGVIAAALGVGAAFLKICTAPDGSASFSVSLNALPSCSGLSSL